VSDPVILLVDEAEDAASSVEAELRERYGRHYRVESHRSVAAALHLLEDLAASGGEVALVLDGRALDRPVDEAGAELLEKIHRLHPQARRALLIDWGTQGNTATGDAIFDAIARGRIDHYVIRPAQPPDEHFHNEVSGLLLEWAEARFTSPHTVFIVGESWSGRAYELREALGRCAMPHSFCLADSEQGRGLIDRAGGVTDLPIVVFPDGTVLRDPSNAELARASGSPVNPEKMDFDLVIVGAGPAGLSAAVYGASEGFSTLVVDEGGIGGQSTSSSLIRNYLGFPRGVSGRRLAQNAYQQAWVFGAKFAFIQRAIGLEVDAPGLAVRLSEDRPVRARAVLLATGASYRRLGIPALEALTGSGVYYGGAASEAPAMVGRDVLVVGGANSAGQAALYLSRYARQVTLVVRADTLEAGMSSYLVRLVLATPNIDLRLGTEVVDGDGEARLEHVVLRHRGEGREEMVDAAALFVLIGAEPRTEWLPSEVRRDDQGFLLTGPDVGDAWTLERPPFLLETSLPGVFAVGDVRHGSVKRVASSVGEGSVAIQMLHQFFAGDDLYPRGRPAEPEALVTPPA
jgi:thioredoxin reductase (NADPH)